MAPSSLDRVCPSCQLAVPAGASYCPSCGAATPTGIDRATGEVEATAPSTAPETEFRERLRKALGEAYELAGLVGRGGFAEVYRARDLKLKRDVAVKTIRYDLHASHVLTDRFQREAEAMAQLRHPNILPLYSVGEREGVAYFIMPLVRGESLRAVLEREGPLPTGEVRRIVCAVASALSEAHSAGMVHRDIKPDNILLEGDERRVLVMDFGIAKARDVADTMLTGTGMIVGTPHYMSPEQASGERELDSRSDIYSLGVVAFQMLTGVLPFDAASVQGIIVKHITEEAPPVTDRRRDCPEDMARAVARCLAKDPGERFGSAAEVADAFGAAQVGPLARGRRSAPALAARAGPALFSPTPDALRKHLGVYVVANAVLLALDLLPDRGLDFAPVVLALWAFPLLSQYARVWMAGHSWQAVVKRGGPPTDRHTTDGVALGGEGRASGGELGEHGEAVSEVRSERAVIVGLVARMPKAEREILREVVPAADGLLARARSLAQQLNRLDRAMDETDARRRRSGAQSLSPGDRELADQAARRRSEALEELGRCRAAINDLRVAMEQALVEGAISAKDAVERSLGAARERLRG
ncbi:MAG: protein kinase [Gemmatimonadales bacterium]